MTSSTGSHTRFLTRLAADTSRLDLAPQAAGLYAISLGLSRNFDNDHRMLAYGMVVYDTLYAWCRDCQEEAHRWPPPFC